LLVVQCDFDDTVTVGNVSVAIREAFDLENWKEMEEEFVSGKYTVEESNIRQYAGLTVSRQEIEEFVKGDVVVRYAFDEFAAYCAGTGVHLAVVSSGLEFYVSATIGAMGMDGVEIHAGHAEFTPNGIRVSYENPAGAPITNAFKDSYVAHFKSQGNTVVFVGDGLSDLGPARLADHVIARDGLADDMERLGLPYSRFETFRDVGEHVERIRKNLEDNDSNR
jgi:2-hydroxy-3-keto-5-methylthiopentenyl-1-phosphate phosphatase|tara:strand:+ start:1843 stop:2508 length:666 start_codon:yes stop_codon:yes gene_type:complete